MILVALSPVAALSPFFVRLILKALLILCDAFFFLSHQMSWMWSKEFAFFNVKLQPCTQSLHFLQPKRSYLILSLHNFTTIIWTKSTALYKISPLSLQAFEFYNKALRCLADRKKSPEVWDTVTWELSGSYFSMGTLLQDFAPLSTYAQEQVTDLYDGTSQASVDTEKVRNPV